MNADVKGALAQLDKSWRAFTHNGQPMSKNQVKSVLEYAVFKGYETTNDIPDNDINEILNNVR